MKKRADNSGIHGDIARTENAGSTTQFGWVFCGFFALVAFLPLLHGGNWRPWALVISCIFALITLWCPQYLQPLNKVWFKFGLLLHHVVSPIIMGIMYYGVLTPLGLIMRAKGTKLLSLGYEPSAKSYWVERKPAGPEPETFKDQF